MPTRPDQVVRYGFTNGLQTSITADLPSPETDQVTTYTFGTTKGASAGDSKIASGHMLQKVTYPGSANSDDVVRFAYNAQGQEIWKQDHAGGVIETTYDLAGRGTSRAVTTLASGFDGAVRRIETAYDSHGRTETVTQYNAASSGSVVDQVKYIHDGWGNLTNFRQDLDSTVGGSGYWEVAYAYAKATGGRNTLRRTQTALPGGEVFKFHYRTGTASNDDKYSRVTTVRDAEDTDLAGYQYNGAGQVVRTELSEVGIFSKSYNGSGTTFGRLDRFNRTLISSWTCDLSTNRDIYKVALGYDRNSNITSQDDAVHTGHDVAYANDDLNRLVDADEGTLASGSIGTRTRRQQWTLNQTGNWNRDKVDLNGDADYLDAGELDDTRTHNAVNELLTRDTNTSSPAEFSLTYDAAGNMTDDGVYKYEWDAFYRLRKVRNQSNDLISEYWYNGLGFLVVRHQDTDGSGKVDGSDKKYHTYYDERWRQIATFRESDALPKEQFVYHCAGNGGWGGSSYIDSTLLRDKDQSTAWTAQADRTETRAYYCQNWRADVVVIVDHAGAIQESVRYSAYGVPIGLPMGDADADGDCDAGDLALVSGWIGTPTYNVRGDFNLDGVLDAKDETIATDNGGAVHGRGVLTDLDFGNRKGYAGYEADAKLLGSKWHVRHRVLDSVLGRWLRRDPLGYVDGPSLQPYVRSCPLDLRDPSGLVGGACRPLWFGGSTMIGGWTIFMRGSGEPGTCYCIPTPCVFTLHVGVGWMDTHGQIVTLDSPSVRKNLKVDERKQIERDWHGDLTAQGEGDPDMNWESDSHDVDDSPREERGGTGDNGLSDRTPLTEEEKFGKWGSKDGRVGSQPRARLLVGCRDMRSVKLRLTSIPSREIHAPAGGRYDRSVWSIKLEAFILLMCGGCGSGA